MVLPLWSVCHSGPLTPAIPVPSSVSTCAGIKPSTHVADENMPSGTEVVKPELLNRKSQRIIEKPKIDIDSLEVTFLKMKSRFSFAPKCCGCQTTDYFKRRWISCDENFPRCKFNDFVCENCFSKSSLCILIHLLLKNQVDQMN